MQSSIMVINISKKMKKKHEIMPELYGYFVVDNSSLEGYFFASSPQTSRNLALGYKDLTTTQRIELSVSSLSCEEADYLTWNFDECKAKGI
jgi:hypothetical protein